jgi:hypothetical protein
MWMQQAGCSPHTCCIHKGRLRLWLHFVENSDLSWEQIFSVETITAFQQTEKTTSVAAVCGLARCLFAQNQIPAPIGRKRWHLPEPCTSADRQGVPRQARDLRPVQLGAADPEDRSLYRTRSGEVDPLMCPKCAGPMRVIAFIEQADVIRKILEHLGLWGTQQKPVPKANTPPVRYVAEDAEGYFPTVDDQVVDPVYPVDTDF